MDEIISTYFHKCDSTLSYNLSLLCSSMLRTGSSNTSMLAAAMGHDTKESFKANSMRLYRLLKCQEFQIDDKLWRCHINLVFDALKERNLIKKGSSILIKVDYTSSTDDFLILTASIDFNGRSIPLFFSMRRYPKRKGMMDQKKMEAAFIRSLKHILSKHYSYVIVADRGFGLQRFAALCADNDFGYVIRMNNSLGLVVNNNRCNLEDYAGSNFDISAHVRPWKELHRFVGCVKDQESWIIITNLTHPQETIINLYKQRFGIEKCFQDQKSSGFNIEASKIRKYDRLKRLLFGVCVAQVLTVILGEFLVAKNHRIKKKSLLNIDVISAYSSLDNELYSPFLKCA